MKITMSKMINSLNGEKSRLDFAEGIEDIQLEIIQSEKQREERISKQLNKHHSDE
jgi:hypothetical protein